MPKGRMAPLDHRALWFLREVNAKLRPGEDRSLDGLNRAGLRFGMECLRVLGQLAPHNGAFSETQYGASRGSLESDDQVRLGDAEQEVLKMFRPCWVDGDKLSWATLNNRALRLGEDYLRHMGLIGDYHGESIFARLVPKQGASGHPTVPGQSVNMNLEQTIQESESGSDVTGKDPENTSNPTADVPEGGSDNRGSESEESTTPESQSASNETGNGVQNIAKGMVELDGKEAAAVVEKFSWNRKEDGEPSKRRMQYKGACAGCGREYPDGSPEAIWFSKSKRWLVLNCCSVAEGFLEEHGKPG